MGSIELRSLAATGYFSIRDVDAFVCRYYKLLSSSRQHLLRFYHDASQVMHPDQNGIMTATTTLRAIRRKILSVDYGLTMVSITAVDTQHSFCGGILVIASGYFILDDNLKRKFNQTFFLAPQAGGYFVLNDILRFTDEQPEIMDRESVSGNHSEAPSLLSEGSSICVKNLPPDVRPAILDNIFSRFGVVREGGIEILRRRKFAFCFVEFEDVDAVQRAIQAPPPTINGRKAVVEVTRSRGRRV